MNERIRHLAEQCWDRRLGGLHFDQEMFAELIIEECARRAEGYSYMSNNFLELAAELRSLKDN